MNHLNNKKKTSSVWFRIPSLPARLPARSEHSPAAGKTALHALLAVIASTLISSSALAGAADSKTGSADSKSVNTDSIGVQCSWEAVFMNKNNENAQCGSKSGACSYKANERFYIDLKNNRVYSNAIKEEIGVLRFNNSLIVINLTHDSIPLKNKSGQLKIFYNIIMKAMIDRISGDFIIEEHNIGTTGFSVKNGKCKVSRLF